MQIAMNEQRRPLVAVALRETRSAFVAVAIVSAVTNILMLTGPLFMMQVYDRVLASRSVPTLVALSALAIGLYVFLGILELIRSRILNQIGQRIEEQLGSPTFDAVMTLPLRMSNKDAVSQPVRDLEQVRQFMSGPGPVAICDMPWLPLYLGILFLFHSYLGWLAFAGALFLTALTLASEAAMRTPMKELAFLAGKRGELLEAGQRNAESLHAMGMREGFASRWRDINSKYVQGQRQTSDVTSTFSTVSKIFRLALQSAVLALGAWLAINQLASPGAMIASSIITSRALAPIEQAIGQWRSFVNARQARRRLEQLFSKIPGPTNHMPLPPPKHAISVAGLSAGAPGSPQPIVRDVSFNLSAGQGLGIIGPSGSGKSTLARALVSVWAPLRGAIRLDGAEIDQWDSETLGTSIGYLSQGVELFDGTIAENISRFVTSPDASQILEAAKLAGAHELILSFPDGYNTRIGAGGSVLSAGQRQRIALARALYGKPFLVVLDEPNASLDSDGENALTGAIAALRKAGSIVIVIAHRPNALTSLDQILVLAHGQVVAFGPRDEVLRKTTMRAVSDK